MNKYTTPEKELQENFEILEDTDSKGKKVDWVYHKLNSLELSSSYSRLGYGNKAFRVSECGSALYFREYEDGEKRLHSANFCKVRLCPMCAWRRSKKIFGQVSAVMDALISDKANYRFVFLTLTCQNCNGADMSDTITKLIEAFKFLTKKVKFKKSVKGFFRALEVTYNIKDDTFHPHFHIVLVVPDYYFSHKDYYITQRDWSLMWQQCLKVKYIPIVHIEVCKSRTEENNLGKAVAEVAKYTVKPSDYIIRLDAKKDRLVLSGRRGRVLEQFTDRVVEVLDEALHNRRLVAFGGIMKDLHKKLNLDDTENGDLVNTGDEIEVRSDLAYVIVKYCWNVGYGNYVKIGVVDQVKEGE